MTQLSPRRVARLFVALAMVFVLSLSIVSPALAADAVLVTVQNTLSVPAADLHVTFTGTGGDIFVDPFSVVSLGCPPPSVPSNPPTVTNTAIIDWGVACVAPGNSVTFVARTANGPLGIASAFWTDAAGANIGVATPTIAPLPAGPGVFGAIKVYGTYTGGTKTYTYTRLTEEAYVRRCCTSARKCTERTYFCVFINRGGRLLESGPWTLLATTMSTSKAKWRKQIRWTWGIFFGLNLCLKPQLMPQGRPPSGFGVPGFELFDAIDFTVDPRFSDDSGQTYRQGSDFTRTFHEIADSLEVSTDTVIPNPPVEPISDLLVQIGDGYNDFSALLMPLINEANDVKINEPSPIWNGIHQDLLNLQQAASNVAVEMQTGAPSNPIPFQNMRDAFGSLAANIDVADPSKRYDNAAAVLQFASDISDSAAIIVSGGLADTVSVSRFASAIGTKVPSAMRSFAQAMWPHINVKLNICDYVWDFTTIDAALVVLSDGATNTPIDSLPLPISSDGQIYIPTAGIHDGTWLRVKVKLPTYLSVDLNLTGYYDGVSVGPIELVGGDANNDDCVDPLDMAQVVSDLGAGGFLAMTSPPPSDVNGDGIVDATDTDIVQANIGQCGPTVTGIKPQTSPRFAMFDAFPNPNVGVATLRFELPEESLVSVTMYNVRGQVIDVLAVDKRYSAGTNTLAVDKPNLGSGVYFFLLSAKGLAGDTVPIRRLAKITVLK